MLNDVTAEHLIPRHAGGKTVAGNIVAAHRKCNSGRQHQDPLRRQEQLQNALRNSLQRTCMEVVVPVNKFYNDNFTAAELADAIELGSAISIRRDQKWVTYRMRPLFSKMVARAIRLGCPSECWHAKIDDGAMLKCSLKGGHGGQHKMAVIATQDEF
jgi:hypothetical protein